MSEQKEVKNYLEYWQLFNEDGDILRVETIVRGIPPLHHDIVFQVVPKSVFDAVVKERDELMELMKILTGQRNNWIEQCFFGSRDSLKQRGNAITECNRQLQKLREVKKSTKVIPD